MAWFARSRKTDSPAAPPPDGALAPVDVPRVDFLIVGAMKCGTTTLRRALTAHPDVHMPDGEQHFFGNHQRYLSVWRDGALDPVAFEEAYAHELRSDRPLVGGKTPNYIISTLTLERIQRFHPDTRIVLMLRCPVARAQSHWNHLLRQRDKGQRPAHMVGATFAEHLDRDEEELARAREPAAEMRGVNVLWRGMYAAQLRNLQHFFPSERVFVGTLEDLKTEPATFLRDLCAFLGTTYDPAMAAAAAQGETRAPGHTERLSDTDRARLRALYAEPVRDLEELLDRRFPTWLGGD